MLRAPASGIDQRFLLAFDQGPRPDVFAVEIQKIEQEEHQRRGVAAVGRGLNHAERSDAVGAHAAQLAIEIGLRPSILDRHPAMIDRGRQLHLQNIERTYALLPRQPNYVGSRPGSALGRNRHRE